VGADYTVSTDDGKRAPPRRQGLARTLK